MTTAPVGTRRQLLVLRGCFALVTGLVLTAGHASVISASSARSFDAIFALWLLLALLPVALYVAVPRNRLTTVACGSLLVVVAAGSWSFVQVSANDFSLLAPMLGFFVSLGISVVAASAPRPT